MKRWKVGDEVVVHCNQDDGDDEECNGGDPMFSPSQRIWGYETPDGSFAQFCRVQARQLLPRPQHLTWEESACYTLTLATAYRMLFGHPPHTLKPGENVLVWGASGGLGLFGVQLSRPPAAMPSASSRMRPSAISSWRSAPRASSTARTFKCWGQMPTVGTPEYNDWLKEAREFGKAIWDITGKATMSISCSSIRAKPTFPVSCLVVKRGGMVVICAGTSGYNLTLDARYLWMHQKRVQGSHFANLMQAVRRQPVRDRPPHRSLHVRGLSLGATSRHAHEDVEERARPGNMAVLVSAPRPGLRTLEDVVRGERDAEADTRFRSGALRRGLVRRERIRKIAALSSPP